MGASVAHERQRHGAARGILSIAGFCCILGSAEARPAHCFTTDDGSFTCEFRMTDPDGSFEIAAPGKPTYILVMSDPDVAFGFVNFGDRNVSLPGRYLRSRSETGCWVNDLTPTKICAE